MRALVIDDSRAMRSILRGILSELDFQVSEAADGPQAIELLDRDPSFELTVARIRGLISPPTSECS